MIEKAQFQKLVDVEINVATLGINCEDWYCCKSSTQINLQEVKSIMIENSFDVVPVYNKEGLCQHYFTIAQSQNNLLDLNLINQDDKIYYLTHVRDVIWKMCNEKRNHYFLSNGRNESDIVGLISLCNFNSRVFYLYIFNLISNVEVEFAKLIESDQEFASENLNKLYFNDSRMKSQLKGCWNRFFKDKKKNIDNDYKEYLYLNQLIGLIVVEEKYKNLNYSRLEDFQLGLESLGNLRNIVAHPVKSLVANALDLESLNKGLEKLYELKWRILNYKNSILN